jgi:acyl-CoA thioester hydrolase
MADRSAEPVATPGAPFTAYRRQVPPEWLDYNGHLHDASYAIVLSDAHEALLEHLGLSVDYRTEHAASMFTVETHIRFLAECSRGQTLTAATVVVEADDKRLRLHSDLYADGVAVATGESLYVHVDTDAGRSAPLPADRRARIQTMLAAHAGIPGPGHVGDGAGAPLRLHRTTAPPEWMDYNDHMSESCYLLAFGDSADAFFRFLGIDEAYRAAGHSLYTSQTHLHHRQEVGLGEPLEMTLQLLDHDRRRLHVFHEMRHGKTGALVASAEQLLVHVDTHAGRSVDLPDHLLARVEALAAAHADLPRPAVVGRPMRIRHPEQHG